MQGKIIKFHIPIATLFLLGSLAVFWFLDTRVNANQMQANELSAQWESEEKRRAEVKLLDDALRSIASEKTQLEKHFAKSSNVVPFLNTLEDLAMTVSLKSEVTGVDIASDKTFLSVSLRTAGTFAGTYRFITLLENAPYELEIVSMTLEKDGGEGEAGVTSGWTGTFKIKLLSFEG